MSDMFETNELLKDLLMEVKGIREEVEKLSDKALLHGSDDIHDAIERADENICEIISSVAEDLHNSMKPESK